MFGVPPAVPVTRRPGAVRSKRGDRTQSSHSNPSGQSLSCLPKVPAKTCPSSYPSWSSLCLSSRSLCSPWVDTSCPGHVVGETRTGPAASAAGRLANPNPRVRARSDASHATSTSSDFGRAVLPFRQIASFGIDWPASWLASRVGLLVSQRLPNPSLSHG